MRGLVIIAFLLLAFALPAPADARDLTRAEYIPILREKLQEVIAQFDAGDKQAAWAALTALEDEVDTYEAFFDGHPAFWWPDLIVGRLARKDKDEAKVEAFTAPIVQALDTPEHRSGDTRMEAMLLLSKSLYSQKRYDEAEVILRGFRQDMTDEVLASTYKELTGAVMGDPIKVKEEPTPEPTITSAEPMALIAELVKALKIAGVNVNIQITPI